MRRHVMSDFEDDKHLKDIKKWAEDGLTDVQIANNLGVSSRSIARWKKTKSRFSQALKVGKKEADKVVVNKLYERATGATTEKTTFKMVKVDPDVLKARRTKFLNQYKLDHPEATKQEITVATIEGVPTYEQIPQTVERSKLPPDVTAMIFWLKNRDSANWRDRRETTIDGSIETNTRVLENMSKEEVAQIAKKKLEEQAKKNKSDADQAKK